MDNANSNDCPNSNQATVDIRAMRITVGTKTRLTLSAKRAIGALDADASSSSFTICEKVVSAPHLSGPEKQVARFVDTRGYNRIARLFSYRNTLARDSRLVNGTNTFRDLSINRDF